MHAPMAARSFAKMASFATPTNLMAAAPSPASVGGGHNYDDVLLLDVEEEEQEDSNPKTIPVPIGAFSFTSICSLLSFCSICNSKGALIRGMLSLVTI